MLRVLLRLSDAPSEHRQPARAPYAGAYNRAMKLPAAPDRDPIGVLTTTRPVAERAKHVRIVEDRIAPVAAQIAEVAFLAEGWNDGLHLKDGTYRTAGWVLALDALNFCFWSQDPR